MSKRKKEYAVDVLKREIEERKMKLKTCPFCGGEAVVMGSDDDCRFDMVVCLKCGLKAKWYHNYKDEAINAWNTRNYSEKQAQIHRYTELEYGI